MALDLQYANRLGAVVSLVTMASCILIFVFRLREMYVTERWLGWLFIATALPYVYLLLSAREHERPVIFYIQLGAILFFILIELILDYIFNVEFRNVKWMTILYVTFFFAGTGGLIGIASLAGKGWGAAAIVLFLIMAFLAFWQRAKTGM
jgi:hypothetical protein